MTVGVLWVVLSALLLGAGTLAQAQAFATGDGVRCGIGVAVRHPLFALGTLAEALGALAHVVALQTVSMAVAQGAVSGGLAVTAVGARLVHGTRIGRRGVAAIAALGAALVALAAVSGEAGTVTDTTGVVVGLAVATLLLALAATAVAVLAPARRGVWLAGVSGLAFAACSVALRVLDTTSALSVATDPALLVLAAAGALACATWTVALRHAGATTVTAVAVIAEVVPPSLLGPVLGDEVGTVFWVVAPLVLAVAAAAAAVLARRPQHEGSTAPARDYTGTRRPQEVS